MESGVNPSALQTEMQRALDVRPRAAGRLAIEAAWRTPETECLARLLPEATCSPEQQARIQSYASDLVKGLRRARSRSSGVDALMKEFALSSQEGVALMCLAEALLRVPDRTTADRLIRDKLAGGDWRAHIGQSPSLFVNAATWGLLITGRLVATNSEDSLGGALTRLLARGGEPLIRKAMDLAMRMLGEQFVTGRDIGEALARGKNMEARGYRYSFDMLGEAAMTADDAQRYYQDYENAIEAIGRGSYGRGVIDGNGISIKLSALHPRYGWSQRERVMAELLPRVLNLCQLARRYDIGLNIDAEESERLDLSLDLLEALAYHPSLSGWDGLGFVVQAYQKRAPFVLDWIIALAHDSGRRLMVRLVKGAYWDAEIKRAQQEGLSDYPVFTRKVHTDVSYLACARKLLAARPQIYPQFATHNAHTLAAVMECAGDPATEGAYEFQCLHGMGESLYDQVLSDPVRRRQVRIYAPVGSHETLLAYLVRRLLENGANSSFVNRIVDESVPIAELVADPVAIAKPLGGLPHPRIVLPAQLYGAHRPNSAGWDLVNPAVRERLAQALQASQGTPLHVAPILAGETPPAAFVEQPDPAAHPLRNPANHHDVVGWIQESQPAEIERALQAAQAAAESWAMTPAAERAACLTRAAALLERDGTALMALAVREAGKTWSNAVAEVREAVDFCHYYAAQAQDFDPATHPPLGPVLCISPWNFPLAIFTGQIAAALVAGNPVLAKPAEQTPLIAAAAVRLLHEAGVPRAVLQLLPGRGESVGAALVADTRIRGVMFTGSTEVAAHINRSLAERGGNVPLIAETGGQNAMVVDSTALPEQVVADVLASSFDSAGQRCSALRVLCLQADVAENMLKMLRGAVAELRIGSPADVRTDVGPVIDAEARDKLERHVSDMAVAGYRITRLPLPDNCANGTFVAPTIIEIDRIEALKGEQFGPVLHVVRYRASEFDHLLHSIQATGYGLTLGVHSRIDETITRVIEEAHVGNLYVNRNMIGAVVGVQPFGGQGLSGTGPKAGGPLYLHRLLARTPGPDLARGAVSVTPLDSHAEMTPFAALGRWLEGAARALIEGDDIAILRSYADQYRQRALAGMELTLPGPTGEHNLLRFVPRGLVAGVAATPAAYIHQLMAALVTGNRLLVDGSRDPVRRLSAQLPVELNPHFSAVNDWEDLSFGALMVEGTADEVDAWRRRMAERSGPIVAVLQADPIYDPGRLVHERTVSINTAAAGGNASLMAIGA